MVRRLKAALVTRWFANAAAGTPTATPILDGLLNGPGWMWSWLYSLLQYVAQQRRISTASGINLDQIALDFFGSTIQRFTNESDTAFAARIKANLLAPKGTRQAVIDALTTLTGFAPTVFEPALTSDTGGYGYQGMTKGTGLGYGVAGGYGSLLLPFQAFITAYRPVSQGIAGSQGYYSLSTRGPAIGGYGVGAIQYGSLLQLAGTVTDADIYATIANVAPEATILWTAITNHSGAARVPSTGATLAVQQAAQTLSAAAVVLFGSGITATLLEAQAAQTISGSATVGGTTASLVATQAAQTTSSTGYVPAVWNANDAVNVTTSNAGLTATTTVATQAGIRSTSPETAGALYAEVTCTTAGTTERVGIANGTWSKSSALGSDNNSISIDPTGAIRINNVVVGHGPTWTAGSTLQIATNFGTKEIWFGVNGSWGTTVASGVSGSQNTGTANPIISGPATATVSAGSGVPLADYITPGSGSFTDASGNVYTLDSSGNADENGQPIPGGAQTAAMEYYNGSVYGEDAGGSGWYIWNGTNWQAAAAPPSPSAGGSVSLTGITLSDSIWPNSANATIDVTCTSGTVAMTVSSAQVPGSGTNSISYSSTTANVQDAAASLVYSAASNGTADTVVIKVIDQVGSTNALSIPVSLGALPNPATGIGGVSFSSMAAGPYMLAFGAAATGAAKTADWGGSAFAYADPAGFQPWNPAPNAATTVFIVSSGSETTNSITLTWNAVTSSSGGGTGVTAPGIPTSLTLVAQSPAALVATWSPPTTGGTPTQYQMQYRAAASPSGTVVTPGGGTIIDAAGNVWAVNTASQVTINTTVDTTTSNVTELAVVGTTFFYKNSSGSWRDKTSPTGTWTSTSAPTIPTPVQTPWINAPLDIASPNGTTVTPGAGTIIDNAGNSWTVTTAGTIDVNGSASVGVSSNVTQLAWLRGNLVQENSSGNWFSESSNNGSWTQVAAPTFPSSLTLSQTITGLTAGTVYEAQVSSANSAGTSPYTAPVITSTVTTTGTGSFTESAGAILDPNGNPWISKGVAIWGSGDAIGGGTMTSSFNIINKLLAPCNTVRFTTFLDGAGTDLDPTTKNVANLVPLVNFATNNGAGPFVVVLSYTQTGSVPTGSLLTIVEQWFTDCATQFKDNPYVHYELLNEPDPGQGDLSTCYHALAAAVRNTGATAPIYIQPHGGGLVTDGSIASGALDDITNWVVSVHFYANGAAPNSDNTNQTQVSQALATGGFVGFFDGYQTIQNFFNGRATIIGEFGTGGAGGEADLDVGAPEALFAVESAVTNSGRLSGCWFWELHAAGGVSDSLTPNGGTLSPSANLNGYGNGALSWMNTGTPSGNVSNT